MQPKGYEDYAGEYVAMLAEEARAELSPSRDMVLPALLRFAGDVEGLDVLDAGCGEGRVSRMLAARGARVLGVDISPTLVGAAGRHADGGRVEYRVADLTKPLGDAEGGFALVVSHLVIDDVEDHRAFVRTLCLACADPGRIVVSMNNPYSAVVRDKVRSYFDSGASVLYRGLSSRGVRVSYHHCTLEDRLSTFHEHGFMLSRLSDVPPPADDPTWSTQTKESAQRYRRFPYFMVLELTRGGRLHPPARAVPCGPMSDPTGDMRSAPEESGAASDARTGDVRCDGVVLASLMGDRGGYVTE